MSIPNTPRKADRSPMDTVTPIQSAIIAPLVANVTNTATSAALVAGLTGTTYTISPLAQYVRVTVSGDSISNSGANNVILTAWVGTVGSGTQVFQKSSTASTGALDGVNFIALIPVGAGKAIVPGNSYTINIGMHGSGAGTNTLAASATAPCIMTIEVI